jgi:hypothetical protein
MGLALQRRTRAGVGWLGSRREVKQVKKVFWRLFLVLFRHQMSL